MKKAALILCFLAFAAYGQQKLVAIINTVDDEEPPVKISELNHLTDRLREIAAKTLPTRNYAVMTQQSILSLFATPEDMINKCNELSGCLVKVGREIAADYIGQGRIGRFGGNLTIKVELYETRRGTLVSSFTGSSKDIYGLLSVLDEKAPDLFKRMLAESGPSFAGGIRDLESAVDMALDYRKRYLVNVSSQPSGAALSFDGVPVASCPKAPCRAELMEGKVRIIAALDQHETLDTTVSVTNNNQNIALQLKSNFGIFEIKPAYSGDIGTDSEWKLSINDRAYRFGANRFSPGEYAVKLSHSCYEDLSFKVGINKGSHEVFDMSGRIKLKEGGLSLSAERDGVPVSEPVFVNGNRVGNTPFDGPVPLCSWVHIGNDWQAVNVNLKHNERVAYKYSMRAQIYSEDIYKPSFEQDSKIGIWLQESKISFWLGLTLDLIGAGLLVFGVAVDSRANDLYDNYINLPANSPQSKYDSEWQEVEDAKQARNILYIVGGLALAAGIGVHIWF